MVAAIGGIVAEDDKTPPPVILAEPTQAEEQPYGVDDAMSGLFVAKEEFERIILSIWRIKRHYSARPAGRR